MRISKVLRLTHRKIYDRIKLLKIQNQFFNIRSEPVYRQSKAKKILSG